MQARTQSHAYVIFGHPLFWDTHTGMLLWGHKTNDVPKYKVSMLVLFHIFLLYKVHNLGTY